MYLHNWATGTLGHLNWLSDFLFGIWKRVPGAELCTVLKHSETTNMFSQIRARFCSLKLVVKAEDGQKFADRVRVSEAHGGTQPQLHVARPRTRDGTLFQRSGLYGLCVVLVCSVMKEHVAP